jgi:hypothetical protein
MQQQPCLTAQRLPLQAATPQPSYPAHIAPAPSFYHACYYVKIVGTRKRLTSARVTVRMNFPGLALPIIKLHVRGDSGTVSSISMVTPTHLQLHRRAAAAAVHKPRRREAASGLGPHVHGKPVGTVVVARSCKQGCTLIFANSQKKQVTFSERLA